MNNNSISWYLWHITIPLCVFNIKAKILSKKFANQTQWLISSVSQSCPTLCHLMDCSTPGFPVHHQLPELTQTHFHPAGDAIQQSHPLSSLSLLGFNLSQHLQSSPRSQFFASGGQNIGLSASVPLMTSQDCSPLGWTGWISLQSKGLSRVFSESINSLALSFLYSPNLTSLHDYWKNHSFD